ncbi:hypothetical protein VTK26DRAFT_3267 [Humicola hyalothermophila]
MKPKKKERQQTLEATLGRPRVKPAIKTPKPRKRTRELEQSPLFSSPALKDSAAVRSSPRAPSSSATFLGSSQPKKRRVVFHDSDSDGENASEDELALPMRTGENGSKGRVSDSSSEGSSPEASDEDGCEDEDEDDEDDDDKPLVTPRSGKRPGRKRQLVVDDSDDDDQPPVSSSVKRRRLVRRTSSPVTKNDQGSDEEDGHDRPVQRSSPRKVERTGRKFRSEKEKARELLRRKRAGESIDDLLKESDSSEEDAPVKALYDTDSDHRALSEFEDDEEGVLELNLQDGKKKKKKKGKKKKEEGSDASGDESENSMESFIADDGPLGVPDDVLAEMPLEFTSHSHKPLKEHFRDAVEWLVQFKLNPGFEKTHQLYRIAWKKLDDEVSGLVRSKFASAAWKKDFMMALRARPYFTSQEFSKGNALEAQNCGACGRSGHPASSLISFSGTPYYKNTSRLETFLHPVEPDTSSGSGSDPDPDGDEDEDGNTIPKKTREWRIGAVCNSNAETAHSLLHWKQALLDWVDTRLHEEGLMAPSRLAERERMRPKQKYKLVDEVLRRWVDTGVVRALYGDFKQTIEEARNKKATGWFER